MTVSEGVTLTLEPGVIVKHSSQQIVINGTLRAEGTPEQPIIFTSYRDDSAGGDTNGDGNASSPAPGDRYPLYFEPASVNSLMNHVVLRYGGGYSNNNLQINTSSLAISECLIENNGNYGIYIGSGSPTITGNTIQGHDYYGIYIAGTSAATITNNTITQNGNGIYVSSGAPDLTITGNTLSGNGGTALRVNPNGIPAISGNTISGNGNNGIVLDGVISQDAVWPVWDAPYYLSGGLTVSEGVTLTLEPGVIVKHSSQQIVINGTLRAEGTPEQPIIFTSYRDDSAGGDTNGDGNASSPAPGDRYPLYFEPASVNSLMNHVVLRYGGGYSNNNLQINTSSLAISECLIENNGNYGIYIGSGSPTITGNTIQGHDYYGIYIAGTSAATITNNTITQNGNGIYVSSNATEISIIGNTLCENNGYAIYTNSNILPLISSNTIYGNSKNGVLVSGGYLSTSSTWENINTPYILQNTLTVNEGITLTIEPGVIIKFDGLVTLAVNGTMNADGTPEQPVYFTSLKDDTVGGDTNGDGNATSPAPGDWRFIQFASSSSGVLDNVGIRYGGCESGHYPYQLLVDTSSLTISNCMIEYSRVYGLSLRDASPIITGNILRNNLSFGLFNETNSLFVNAEYNYWGDPTGPYDPSDDRTTGGLYNPTGKGDKVSDYVDYDPWLVIEPFSESPILRITYPNTVQFLIKGKEYTITWASTNVSGDIQIDLYKGGTDIENFIAQLAANAPNTGHYSFIPSSDLPDGNDYLIKISSENGVIKDFSDTSFSIYSLQTVPDNYYPPIALCKNISLALNENGEATLNTSQIDNGSYDPDGYLINMDLNKQYFTKLDIGKQNVELIVIDNKGASSSCYAEVLIYNTVGSLEKSVGQKASKHLVKRERREA